MKIYAKKVYGFDLENHGALGFSSEKARHDLAAAYRPGDRVLYWGTKGEETPEEMQGRLLGLVAIETKEIYTEQLTHPDSWKEILKRNSGKPRWPYGLPVLSAEQFDPPYPVGSEVLPRLWALGPRAMANKVELLSPDETAIVLNFPKTTVESIYTSDAIGQARARSNVRMFLRNKGGREGPVPALKSKKPDNSDKPAVTYCMELQGSALPYLVSGHQGSVEFRKVYKIGWAVNELNREKNINAHSPDLECLCWKVIRTQPFESKIPARNFEQKILKRLKSDNLVLKNEIVFCHEKHLSKVWNECLINFLMEDSEKLN